MLGQVSVAAATAVLGYDLTTNTTWRTSSRPRRLKALGMAGSAVILDTKADVFIGSEKVGELFNSSLLAVNRNTDMFSSGKLVPAGEALSVLIVDAPATSALQLTIDFDD